MEMYNVHQNATLLPINLKSDDYVVGTEKLPAVSASASRDKDGVVHISLVNIDPDHTHKVSLSLDGKKFAEVKASILASASVNDFNSFDEPGKIKPEVFKNAVLKNNAISINMPSASVIVLTLN
jgi:alpha-L-arabinofuranosidase